jgi:hypothetical protein
LEHTLGKLNNSFIFEVSAFVVYDRLLNSNKPRYLPELDKESHLEFPWGSFSETT